MMDDETENLLTLAKVATQGKWTLSSDDGNEHRFWSIMADKEQIVFIDDFLEQDGWTCDLNNLKFISAANPETIIKLCAENKNLKAQIDEFCDRGPRHDERLAIRQLRTDRADEAWNEAIDAAAYIPHANASNSRKELRYETEKFCIGIRDEIIRLKRPTQSKPELTVGLFKVGDWVIRKPEYQTAPWIWGGQPCEITGVRENTINIKVYGVSLNGTWGFSFFTLAPTTEQSLDELVIMPAWDDLPKEQKKDDGIHWVSPNGAFVDEQGYTFIRNALQSLQKSKKETI